MGPFAGGTVVVVPFPYSNLAQAVFRPAVIIARASAEDWVSCQVTSNPYGDNQAIELGPASFQAGGLRVTSYARPTKLFTLDRGIVRRQIGSLTSEAFNQIVDTIIRLLDSSRRTS